MDKSIHVITIDTEFSTHRDDMGIVGRIGQEEYGVSKIMELLDRYSVKATFFIDVYGYKKVEEDKLKDICIKIKDRGHDLELHTHPDGLFDRDRGCMAKYNLEEQIDIIKRGKELFKEWFGVKPIAHRAGDWGANYDTLRALSSNDIRIDCSMFIGGPECGLNESATTNNKPVVCYSLLEIPATAFRNPTLGLFNPYHYITTDGNSMEEIRYVIRRLEEKNVRIIVSIYHSFSFLGWDSKRDRYWVDSAKIKKFDSYLKEITKNGTESVKTIREVYEIFRKDPDSILNSKDIVPESSLFFSLMRVKDRLSAFARNGKNGKGAANTRSIHTLCERL